MRCDQLRGDVTSVTVERTLSLPSDASSERLSALRSSCVLDHGGGATVMRHQTPIAARIKVVGRLTLVIIPPDAMLRCTTYAAVTKIFFRVNFHEINRSHKKGKTIAIFSLA